MSWELLAPGSLVAERYRVLSRLARGGFGAVYVAEQLATERRVALKVLWPNVLESASAVERFMLEARIAGRVNSEHIVQVIDAGVDLNSSAPFLVMELLEGMDVQRLVERNGPLAPAATFECLRQVAVGLDKAHGYIDRSGQPAPIVHRDLKPENLFATQREDGTPVYKILDFGIAKVLSSASSMSREVRGTPLYMASEQASHGDITPATDVWAFALVAFFLLTGRSYWRSANLEEANYTQLFGEILALPLVPPSQRAQELGAAPLPARFDDWFFRCVNRDPSARFQRCGEAARALGPALLGQEVAINATSMRLPSPSVPPRKEVLATEDHFSVGGSTALLRPRTNHKLWLSLAITLPLAGAAAWWLLPHAFDETNVTPQAAASPSVPLAPMAEPSASSLPHAPLASANEHADNAPPHVAPVSTTTAAASAAVVPRATPRLKRNVPRAAPTAAPHPNQPSPGVYTER